MKSANRIAAQIIGWLFAVLGWTMALCFGLPSLGVILTVGPVPPFLISSVPWSLVGVAAAMFGRSIGRSLLPATSGGSASHG